jgi:hypothetical protein
MRNVWATTLLSGLLACTGSVTGDGDNPSGEDDTPTDSDDTDPDDPQPDIDAAPPGQRNDAPARLIETGGVGNAPLWEVLHVHAIDERSGAPLAGATVKVGALTATTDAAGLASFDDASLKGPLAVTVTAAGHAGATWIGVDGANLTVALLPDAAIASAKVTGSLTLPNPPIGDYSLGVALSTFTEDISAAENQLPQPMDGDTPANIMLRSFVGNDSSFELTTRTGRQRVYVLVVAGKTNGTTEDLSDDTLTISKVAVADAFTLSGGQTQAAPAFSEIAAADMLDFSVGFAGALPGLDEQIAFPVIDLGADGKLVLPVPPLAPGKASTKVPPATGSLAGSYEVVGLASPAGEAAIPFSTIVKRDVNGNVDLGAWLAVPSGISGSAGSYTFTAPPGASIVSGQFVRGNGSVEHTVTVLGGATTLPVGGLAQATELQLAASEVPGFDARNFSLGQVKRTFTRASGAKASVAP